VGCRGVSSLLGEAAIDVGGARPNEPPRLRVVGLSKRFGALQAVDSVDVTVGAGQILGLVGANGAGKSTLIRILAGAIEPDAGTIELDGDPVILRSPRAALLHGVAVIHQELQLVGAQSIAENLFIGVRRPGRFGLIDWPGTYKAARKTFASLGQQIDVTKPVDEASVWERWATQIARALIQRHRILVLDEPTAAMDPDGVKRLFGAVRTVRDEGCAVIFVSHRLEEVMDLCDRVQVMRNGVSVADLPREGLTSAKLVDLIVGEATIPRARPDSRSVRNRPGAGHSSARLEVQGLSVPGRVADVSFQVAAGEILGLAGLVGSGRSTVLRALAGGERATGHCSVEGARVRLGSPASARANGIALVPEDRLAEGLFHDLTVAANIGFGKADVRRRRWLISHPGEADRARHWIDRLAIRGATSYGSVLSLSGGNQQKTLFARVLDRQPRVLLLDEPTRGVDVGAKGELLELVEQCAADGVGCVVALSDVEELAAVVDRVVVLREGHVVRELAGADSNAKAILEACYGHE
jgi:ABC-type sugar transport system ATPase subunit